MRDLFCCIFHKKLQKCPLPCPYVEDYAKRASLKKDSSDDLRLRSTAPKAVGIANLSLYISKPVTDIYLKHVTVEQHMKEIYYLEPKKLLL